MLFDLQEHHGDEANKTKGDAGESKTAGGALLVAAAARAALGSVACGASLLELALADILALLELALGLEGFVEVLADSADVTSRLEVENTLDEVQRRR